GRRSSAGYSRRRTCAERHGLSIVHLCKEPTRYVEPRDVDQSVLDRGEQVDACGTDGCPSAAHHKPEHGGGQAIGLLYRQQLHHDGCSLSAAEDHCLIVAAGEGLPETFSLRRGENIYTGAEPYHIYKIQRH